jgi:hypothetical protein
MDQRKGTFPYMEERKVPSQVHGELLSKRFVALEMSNNWGHCKNTLILKV